MPNIKEMPLALDALGVGLVDTGMKTQHRMLVKPVIGGMGVRFLNYGGRGWQAYETDDSDAMLPDDECRIKCPLGNVGDIIWLKEKWRVGAWDHDAKRFAIDYEASPTLTNTAWLSVSDDDQANVEGFYRVWSEVADELSAKGIKRDVDGHYRWSAGQAPMDWRSAESMPRWASRITLEITDIKIQQIQDITGQEAYAEGCPYPKKALHPSNQPYLDRNAIAWFVCNWKDEHGEQSYLKNDMVWAVTFKVIDNRCAANVDRFNKPVKPSVDVNSINFILSIPPDSPHYSESRNRLARKLSGKRID